MSLLLFFSFLNSCLDVNWTVCLDLGRWMLWLLFYVNVSVMAKWNETRKKREKTEPSFFLSLPFYLRILSFHIKFSIIRPSNENFPHFACVHAFVWVHIFAVYWRRTLYLLCTSFEDCILSSLCFHTSFGNLILMRQLQGGLLQYARLMTNSLCHECAFALHVDPININMSIDGEQWTQTVLTYIY